MNSRLYTTAATTHQVAPRGAQRGEATGDVLCPRRGAHIAEMRCGEYQERDGCRLRCPNAVKPERLAALKMEIRERPLEGRHVQRAEYGSHPAYDHCVECGSAKSPNPSPRCRHCVGALHSARQR